MLTSCVFVIQRRERKSSVRLLFPKICAACFLHVSREHFRVDREGLLEDFVEHKQERRKRNESSQGNGYDKNGSLSAVCPYTASLGHFCGGVYAGHYRLWLGHHRGATVDAFYDPKQAILLMFVVGLFMSIMQAFLVRRDAQYKLIGVLFVGFLLAQPVGLWIFTHPSTCCLPW